MAGSLAGRIAAVRQEPTGRPAPPRPGVAVVPVVRLMQHRLDLLADLFGVGTSTAAVRAARDRVHVVALVDTMAASAAGAGVAIPALYSFSILAIWIGAIGLAWTVRPSLAPAATPRRLPRSCYLVAGSVVRWGAALGRRLRRETAPGGLRPST